MYNDENMKIASWLAYKNTNEYTKLNFYTYF